MSVLVVWLTCPATTGRSKHSLALHSREQSAHQELKKACRATKRERLFEGLRQIEAASSRGDSKAFYGFVKLVSPKPFTPTIKLRYSNGMTMTKMQEGEGT